MSRREALWRQRLALQQRSGHLREQLVQHGQALRPVFATADQVRDAGHWLRRHRWVPALAAVWLAWRRPRRVVGWGLTLWRSGRWAWRWVRVWQRLR